jgi:transcriptional regulator with XRE-family HTH domain
MADTGKMFRARLRERRQTLGLSQQQLGKRLGVTQAYVSQLESGAVGLPALDGAVALAAALETSLMYLAGLTDNALPIPGAEGVPSAVDELLRVARPLPSELQEQVLGHARLVADAETRRTQDLRVVGNAYAGIYSALPAKEADALISEIETALAHGDIDALRALRLRLAARVTGGNAASATADYGHGEGTEANQA